MLFYLTLFLGLLYFKVFRVRRKQEKTLFWIKAEGFFTNSAILGLIVFGFMTQTWYIMLIALVLMSIIASLIITAVQLGFFVDGKPIFGISKLYTLMPLLALSVIFGSIGTAAINYLG